MHIAVYRIPFYGKMAAILKFEAILDLIICIQWKVFSYLRGIANK